MVKESGEAKEGPGRGVKGIEAFAFQLKDEPCVLFEIELSGIFQAAVLLKGGVSKEVVFLGDPQSFGADQGSRLNDKRYWEGILQWFKTRISNGILEGINNLIQAAKARARGYRTTKNFITMIYLIGGKLNFRLPT